MVFNYLTESLWPLVTNAVDLGAALNRWRKFWSVDADFSGVVTISRTPVDGTDAVNKTYADALTPNPTVEEVDGAPSYTDSDTIRFDQADGFVLTQPGAGIVRVDISQIPAANGGTGMDNTTGSTFAGLPAAGTAGRLARVTNTIRGLWMDQGSQWFSLAGEIVNVKEFNAKGDNSTNDTTAITAAINAANAAGSLYLPSTLYFPPGLYKVATNTLPTITCSVYGPDASIQSLTQDDNAILTVDYSGIGRSMILRGVFGPNYPGTHTVTANQRSVGVHVIKSDHATFVFGPLEGLYIGLHFNANSVDGHIAQSKARINSVLHCQYAGILCTSGATKQVETNRFEIEYITNCGSAVRLNANAAELVNNHFDVNSLDTHVQANQHGFNFEGTAANNTKNKFVVSDSLTAPTGTGKFITMVTGVVNNYFELPYIDFTKVTMDAGNMLNLGSHEINIPGTAVQNARSILWRDAAPTAGYWMIGDVCWNNATTAGENVGWMCTAAGAPGTWRAFGPTGGTGGRNVPYLHPLLASLPAVNPPALVLNAGTNQVDQTLDFDDTTSETAYWEVIVPTGIAFTTATMKLSYRVAAATSGAVVFNVHPITRGDNELWDVDAAGQGAAFAASTVPGVAVTVRQITVGLNITGWAAGEVLRIKLFRVPADGGDTLIGDCKFMGAEIYFD